MSAPASRKFPGHPRGHSLGHGGDGGGGKAGCSKQTRSAGRPRRGRPGMSPDPARPRRLWPRLSSAGQSEGWGGVLMALHWSGPAPVRPPEESRPAHFYGWFRRAPSTSMTSLARPRGVARVPGKGHLAPEFCSEPRSGRVVAHVGPPFFPVQRALGRLLSKCPSLPPAAHTLGVMRGIAPPWTGPEVVEP